MSDLWTILASFFLFCFDLLEIAFDGSLLGGWQDGATAVCVWVLGQTVSLLSS